MIYFWDLQALKEQWKTGQYTDRHTFHYGVATAIAVAAYNYIERCLKYVLESPAPRTPSPSILLGEFIGVLLALTIGYFAVRAIYRANGGDEGRRILDKTLSINFVLLMRFYPAIVPVGLFVFAVPYLDPKLVVIGGLLIMIGCFAAVVVGFEILRRSLKEVRAHELKLKTNQS